ncbi:MAG TPA: hypothetical protein VGF94_15050 [Kofleriaceae bacterium]|jgi:hypothetical protein
MRLACLVVVLAACAHDVHVHYPSLPSESTGTLVLLLTEPANDVSVAVGGILVVDHAHTGRVVIDGVPVGTAEVMLAANGQDKPMKIWVTGEHATTMPLGVADSSPGFVKSLAATLLAIVAYAVLLQ